jgi:uroporphyrinogen decarboxylase
MKMTGTERMIKALKGEIPDTVPHFELVIDPKVREAILPGSSHNEFTEYMDLDAVIIYDKVGSWKFDTVDKDKKIFRDQWGALTKFTSEVIGHPIGVAIKNEKDLEHFVPPDPDEEWRYEPLKKIIKRFKGERAVIAHATDVFNISADSMLGPEEYFKNLIANPDLVDRVQEIVLNYNLKYIKNCMELDPDVLCISGDWAMSKGPFVSPKNTARFLIPALKKQVDVAHQFGKPAFKHTDGNVTKILDLLVETGIEGFHPIDPLAGMDLGEVKEKYGKKICLMGNVNCASTLSWKSLDEVRQEVKECIKKAGYGGGYICMSSNSIHSGVKPENYVAMVKAIREFGRYPLELD